MGTEIIGNEAMVPAARTVPSKAEINLFPYRETASCDSEVSGESRFSPASDGARLFPWSSRVYPEKVLIERPVLPLEGF